MTLPSQEQINELQSKVEQLTKQRDAGEKKQLAQITEGISLLDHGATEFSKAISIKASIKDGALVSKGDKKMRYLVITGEKTWTGYDDDDQVAKSMGLHRTGGFSFKKPDVYSIVQLLGKRGHTPLVSEGGITTVAYPISNEGGKTVVDDMIKILDQAKQLTELVDGFNNGHNKVLEKLIQLRTAPTGKRL